MEKEPPLMDERRGDFRFVLAPERKGAAYPVILEIWACSGQTGFLLRNLYNELYELLDGHPAVKIQSIGEHTDIGIKLLVKSEALVMSKTREVAEDE